MKVYLAGYNIDTTVLRELQGKVQRNDVTPEVLSAAYARISRDPRPVNNLREDARKEIERARKSNKTIIFKMGHHSVAEHAVFNFDIIDISRLAMEEVEKFRLCSYTEKSQRYITLEKGFIVPEEIKNTRFENSFIGLINKQNEAYLYLVDKLTDYVFNKHKDLAANPKKHNLLEGWAKEDARYITALATQSQAGHTLNARNLELLLRRFASHPLKEVQELGRKIYSEIASVAPSIVLFYEANDRDKNSYPDLKDLAGKIIKTDSAYKGFNGEDVDLVEFTPEGDNVVCASLLHTSGNLLYRKCKEIVNSMPFDKKREIFKASWKNMQFYDSMLREFEYVNLTFNIVLSAACFGQLKRHRMATITVSDYDPSLGNTIPESIKEIGYEKKFLEIVEDTNKLYESIKKEIPIAAPYVLTNSHRRRVLIRVNARELYHISRLREDNHAQWDIRNIASRMSQKAKEVMPLTFELIGGKDRYSEIYKSVFGELPKVTKSVLPSSREIKS